MELSDQERKLLEQLEASLKAEDPTFAETLSGRGQVRIHRRRAAIAGLAFLVGVVALLGGIPIHPAVSIVGFAVTKPSDDPDATPTDGELAEPVVDPDARTQAHGSRLMQAAVDTLRTDGFTVATMWVPTTDDTMHEFLISGGWGADGAHREATTDDGEHSLKLTRFHTAIA